jgi:Sulfotransferase domain
MVVLCDGMMRSGSTWSFNVALKLVQAGDPDRKVFGLFSDAPAVPLAAVRPRSSHLVIKTHHLSPSAYDLCCTGAIRAIYTWRHPYDAIVSGSRMFGFSMEHWIDALRNALRVWSFHRATDSACIVSYEAIMREPSASIERIASYLDLRIQPEKVRQIAEETSIERLKGFSEKVDELDFSRVVRKEGVVYDRQTLLHHNHIRDGRIGHGATILDAEQLQAIDAVLREEGFEFLCGQPAGVHPV